MSNPENREVPELARPIVDELIEDKLLTSDPDLSPEQWSHIAQLVEPFSFGGPNKNARHVRRKLAYYHLISHAVPGQVRLS